MGLLCLLSLFSLPGQAQGRASDTHADTLLHRDYDFVETTTPWLTSSNAAFLTRYASGHLSEAKVSLGKENGGLTDYSGSRDAIRMDASVASYYRINPCTVVSGSMSYANFTGKDMGGSAFINTHHQPFDIEEDSLTNLGKKHLDRYHLTGGVGIDLYRGLSVGAHLDYTAANYAKYKDLRHKNKLMDMTLTVGAMVPIGPHVVLGANYHYRRNTESVTFSTYGREDKVYKSFINYGPFIGEVEQFEGNGFTEKAREMPMVNDYNGGGLQVGVAFGRLTLTHELTAAHRSGYYGRKSPYTITFSHHTSNVYDYHGQLSVHTRRHVHLLDVRLKAENLVNELSTYREKSNENGAYYYEYYDAVKTANKLWSDGEVAYALHLGVEGEQPTWTLKAHYSWMHRKQTAYFYPYYRRQRLSSHEGGLSLMRHLTLRHGVLTLMAEGAYKKGSGAPFDDHTFTEPSDKQTPPPTMEAWLYREHQWLTAAQYTVGGSVRYTFVMPHVRMATYIEALIRHHKANERNAYSVGSDHTRFTIQLGCRF